MVYVQAIWTITTINKKNATRVTSTALKKKHIVKMSRSQTISPLTTLGGTIARRTRSPKISLMTITALAKRVVSSFWMTVCLTLRHTVVIKGMIIRH